MAWGLHSKELARSGSGYKAFYVNMLDRQVYIISYVMMDTKALKLFKFSVNQYVSLLKLVMYPPN